VTDGDKPAVRPQDADASLEGRQSESTPEKHKGGRPKGAKDKRRSRARIAAQNARRGVKRLAAELGIDFFNGNGLQLLQFVYKDPRQPTEERIKAANMAMPYESPRLASVVHSGSVGTTSHEEALEQLRAARAAIPATPAVTKH
jgi:hypothetical protein